MRYTRKNNANEHDARLSRIGTASVPRREADSSATESVISKLVYRFNGWRLNFSPDGEAILRGAVIAVIIVVFTLVQTTLFARFRPFGAVPDLLLPLVIAVGALEKERWGAVVGLVSAFIIDAACGVEITLLPLLYVPAGFAVGILTTHSLRDSFAVNVIYTFVSSVLRGVITLIIVKLTLNGIAFGQAILEIVLPELAANLLFAALPQCVTRLCLCPFHKTRAERTGYRAG